MIGSAALRGELSDVRGIASISTLRRRFAHLAADLDSPDLDAGALKLAAPRRLTQTISGWAYREITPPVRGIAFSTALSDKNAETIRDNTSELLRAMAVHGLHWLEQPNPSE